MELSLLLTHLVSLITLSLLEIVLGVDNLIFISIVTSRLPKHQQKLARKIGLLVAWITRLVLLASVVWIIKLRKPLFNLFGQAVTSHDLLLIGGGLFLIFKSTFEIHNEIEQDTNLTPPGKSKYFFYVIGQIAILDIIFSLDSILTAIGLTQEFLIMAIAITIAIITMIFASEPLNRLVHKYPTIKMLALSFLLMIGMVLIADGFEFHIPRGYLYFAVCFSVIVEVLNSLMRNRKRKRKKAHAN